MNSPSNHGPTGSFSSACFKVLGTFPLLTMFLLCFSLASLILCFEGMLYVYSCLDLLPDACLMEQNVPC